MWITKKQFRGAWFLSLLIILVSIVIHSVPNIFSQNFIDNTTESDSLKLDSLVAEIKLRQLTERPKYQASNFDSKQEKQESAPLQLHDFDPNTISREEWLSMNLPEKVFNGLEKYRDKGGKIKKPEGVLKLYNLDPAIAQQMVPFVKIDSSIFARKKLEFKNKLPFPEKPKYLPFNINEADTTQLMSIYGIGRGLANRMVRHRDALGGFLSKNYVYDVFGLDSSTVEELFLKAYLPTNVTTRKLNINKATEEELAKNPYIRKGFARIITKYRTQNGDFKKPEDLLKIKIMKPEVVNKIAPYLEF
jgi:competence protein ComEA